MIKNNMTSMERGQTPASSSAASANTIPSRVTSFPRTSSCRTPTKGSWGQNHRVSREGSLGSNQRERHKRSIPIVPGSFSLDTDITNTSAAVVDYGKVPPRRSGTRIDRDLRQYLSEASGIVTVGQQDQSKGSNGNNGSQIGPDNSDTLLPLRRQCSAAATPRTQRSSKFIHHRDSRTGLSQAYPDRRSQFHRRSLPLSPLRLNMNNATNKSSPARNPASASTVQAGPLPDPVEVLNGSPGYINLLDALNAWQLAKDLGESLDLPAVASFKHVAPVGAAVGVPLTKSEAVQCMVNDSMPLSALASAYARARDVLRICEQPRGEKRVFLGTDRIFALGDFVALSDTCDLQTAKLLSREVSDGIIAPSYESLALDLLCRKKQGTYCILKIDPNYRASEDEERSVFGLRLKQKFSGLHVSPSQFENVLPKPAVRDLVVAMICLKYAQNNSLCYAKNGQMIGMGLGLKSKAQTTRLANQKAFTWWLRHHPRILRLPWKTNVKRAERVNAVDAYLNTDTREDLLSQFSNWDNLFDKEPPKSLTQEDRNSWKQKMKDVCLVSDAFYPFPENIDDWLDVGVGFVGCTGGSASDGALMDVCNERGIALCHTGIQMSS